VAEGEVAGIEAFQHRHPWVFGKGWRHLAVADVDGGDMAGAALEQHLGEAAGRGAKVERGEASGRDAKWSSPWASLRAARET
jgi:hypothetical protein